MSPQRTILFFSLALLCGFSTLAPYQSYAEAAKIIPQAAPSKDPRAITALKKMSDALSSAKSLSFISTAMTPVRVPSGGWIHVFSTAKVDLKRPSHLFIETGGDAFAQGIYFDGNTFSVIARDSKFYSQEPMPGSVDNMLDQAASKAGYTFPFSDVLLSNPYDSWSKDLESARYIGQSTRGKEKLQHFAFAAKSVDWEVWTDQKTHLPRMVFVKYVGAERSPTVLIEFNRWKRNPDIADSRFAFHAPADAKKLPLKSPEGSAK